MMLAVFSLHVFSVFEVRYLHFAYSKWNRLNNQFIFKFVSLHQIPVENTNITFFDQLNSNPFMRNFVNFTIVVLTWYDFTSYTKVLLI